MLYPSLVISIYDDEEEMSHFRSFHNDLFISFVCRDQFARTRKTQRFASSLILECLVTGSIQFSKTYKHASLDERLLGVGSLCCVLSLAYCLLLLLYSYSVLISFLEYN